MQRSAAPFSDEALEETARLAIRDLEAHGEILTYYNGDETWYASEVAEMPLSCRARLAAIDQADKHKVSLGSELPAISTFCTYCPFAYTSPVASAGFLAAIATFLWARHQLAVRSKTKEQVRLLVQTTLSELRKQHNAHFTDPVLTPSSHIAPSHLRDLILQNEHSPAQRQLLWHAVEKVVEGNANVRSKQVEHNGEELRAWEWTGVGGGRDMIQSGGEGSLYPKLLQ